MANDCIPYFESEATVRLTFTATAAITGKRCVDVSADIEAGPALNTSATGGNIKCATAAAGAKTIGVAKADVASGSKGVAIGGNCVLPITADGAITAGQRVEVGTAGKVRTLATGIAIGEALNTVIDGADCMVRLDN